MKKGEKHKAFWFGAPIEAVRKAMQGYSVRHVVAWRPREATLYYQSGTDLRTVWFRPNMEELS